MRYFPACCCHIAVMWCLVLANQSLAAEDETPNQIEFNRDIRPILSANCWQCHGPDSAAREADLRLDQQEAAHADRGGHRVIDAERPEQSELLRRITSSDQDVRMPPPDATRQLAPGDVELLTRWIEQGGEYEAHWSLIPPVRTQPPESPAEWTATNPIDRFVQQQLQKQGLVPASQANRETLIRRVTLDLTGLPPTPDEVDAFLGDERPDAYEELVDRLLASPQYGERMARVWLDAARFADSGGYQGDILRSMWIWRDWVINAYNANMPFDQFTIEQLAGDLLPEPTQDQIIATGFNRNHRINDEDGIIYEEFRVEYVADRVETTATVWLGLTARCARCHDHKFDAFSQADYYRLYAFYNSIDEEGRGRGNAPPLLHLIPPNVQQQLDELSRQIEAARSEKKEATAETGAGSAAAPVTEDPVAALEKQRTQLLASVPNVMVMRERAEPRPTHVLIRGAYDRPGDEVTARTPAAIGPGFDGFRNDRLGLAQWLIDPRNPLTARVAVNRYWQMYFGRGLVEAAEDFGTQGPLPSHPELLDWLATEFVRTGWDVKGMQRLIVTSATYRQASTVPQKVWQRDPDNRWLSRGPRFRLSAETIRDQALAASGLLQERVGGPSVRPYQPPKLWQELAALSQDYNQSTGADLYRRSLYSFVRRTIPLPSMTTLDAPNRELCVVRRPTTNTPLQALTLMNDETWVEAARALATRCLLEMPSAGQDGNSLDRARITQAFRLLLVRQPTAEELEVLTASLRHYRLRFAAKPEDAQALIAVGESNAPATLAAGELAAMTSVCSLLVNLDETVTRE